jgi:RNA polymerase-interacting CarD/CdnL/TRCF family regulator
MGDLFKAILAEAMKSGEFSIIFLVVGCMSLASVVIFLYRKNEQLHRENSELLREMLEHANEHNEEKTRLVEEINKTIALILATLPQYRSNNNVQP